MCVLGGGHILLYTHDHSVSLSRSLSLFNPSNTACIRGVTSPVNISADLPVTLHDGVELEKREAIRANQVVGVMDSNATWLSSSAAMRWYAEVSFATRCLVNWLP